MPSHRSRSLITAVAILAALSSQAQETPEPPGLEFAFEVRAEVANPLVVGELPAGTRRIIDIIGGTVEGPGISGTIRPGGADWQMIRREDGFTEGSAQGQGDSPSDLFVRDCTV